MEYKLYTNTIKFPFGNNKETNELPFLYRDIKFPYFPSKVNAVKPIGTISLQKFIDKHKDPSKDIIDVFKKIEYFAEIGDKENKDELKQTKLFYFTPSVNVTRRDYSHIESFNPLMVAEYDKIGEEASLKLKKLIFNRFKSCICAYLSPSKKGVKFLFKIPVVKTVDEYKSYFYGLAYYLSQIEGFDGSNQNPTLPLFLSYDYDMFVRPVSALETWTTRGYKENEFKVNIDLKNYTPPTDFPKEHKEWAISNIENTIRKADLEQNGHVNVRSAALIAGGYCSGGYLSEHEAWSVLESAMDSSNYLKKGMRGYKKTAEQMFRKGMSAPLNFD